MVDAQKLITTARDGGSVDHAGAVIDQLDIWSAAIKRKSAAGRGKRNKLELYGIKKLRELILDLAVRGLLVPQDPNDEPASVLLEKIAKEKARLIKEGKIKKQKVLPEISEDEKPFELPQGWEWSRLNNSYDVRDGTHDSPKPQMVGYPLVTSKNLYTGKLDISNVNYISKKDHVKIIERSRVDRGDILFAMIGSIGNPVIVDIDDEFSIKNVALFKYYNTNLSVQRYLQIYLEYAAIEIKEQAAGGVQSFVSLGKLRSYVIAVPPLAEQHRIVAKVDELMALCDQLEQQQSSSISAHETLVKTLLGALAAASEREGFNTAWSRIEEHFHTLFTTESSIEQLKQTILQLAVMGKLVPQDPNDEPASVLLEKIAKEKARLIKEGKIKKQKALPEIGEGEKPFELPEGWEWCRLVEISIVGTGATPSRDNLHYYNPPKYNWVTSGETGSEFIYKTKEHVSPQALQETNVSIYPVGTLIVAMYGQGKTRGQITELMIDAGTNQACAAIQLYDKSEDHRKYTKLYFKKAYEELRSHAAGGAQPNLNVGKISLTVIPIPPVSEQHRIVAKVDELMALCDTVKIHLNTAQTTQLQLADSLVEQAIG